MRIHHYSESVLLPPFTTGQIEFAPLFRRHRVNQINERNPKWDGGRQHVLFLFLTTSNGESQRIYFFDPHHLLCNENQMLPHLPLTPFQHFFIHDASNWMDPSKNLPWGVDMFSLFVNPPISPQLAPPYPASCVPSSSSCDTLMHMKSSWCRRSDVKIQRCWGVGVLGVARGEENNYAKWVFVYVSFGYDL